jgi:hypothetical protein
LRFAGARGHAKATAGFTLAEIMVAMGCFSLLIAGVVTANLFGLRLFQISQAKLLASDDARKSLGRMTTEIRASSSLVVGDVSNSVFVAAANGEAQAGGGLMIYPTTNTASYILYFINTPDGTFRRTSTDTGTTILATSVTNTTVFQAQDFLGNTLTNNQNNRVIHCCLEVYSPEAQSPVPSYFKVETSVTQRSNP